MRHFVSTGSSRSATQQQRFPLEWAVCDHIGVRTQDLLILGLCHRGAHTDPDLRLPVTSSCFRMGSFNGVSQTPHKSWGVPDTPHVLGYVNPKREDCLAYVGRYIFSYPWSLQKVNWIRFVWCADTPQVLRYVWYYYWFDLKLSSIVFLKSFRCHRVANTQHNLRFLY